MKQELELQASGKSTHQFPVRNQTAMLHIKTAAATQVRFFLAVPGEEESLYYQSLYVDTMVNEPMVNLSPNSLMRIETDQAIEELFIEWANN